jgi:hypothetical protein
MFIVTSSIVLINFLIFVVAYFLPVMQNLKGIHRELSIRSTCFDKYVTDSLQITGRSKINSAVIRIALMLQENQKDKEFALMEKEKEKELALQEKEKELALQEKDFEKTLFIKDLEKNKLEAYYLSILADLSQRELIEMLFSQAAALIISNNTDILNSLGTLEDKVRKSLLENCRSQYPKATTINSALSNYDQLREVIWSLVGLKAEVKLPKIADNLLYPILSSTAHVLGIRKVFVRTDLDPNLIEFFKCLSILYRRQLEYIDAELVALAKDDFDNKPVT